MPRFKALAMPAAFVIAAAAAVSALADDQSQKVKDLANTLMQTTKVIAITNLTDPATFVPDNDPNTLQIVYIENPTLGKTHVSDDGEVIWFFGDPSVAAQQPFIFDAFDIRAKRRLGLK